MGRYADAVTRILLEQGDARAQGALAQGQAWGQMAQQLGQIPSQVIDQQQQMQAAKQRYDLNQQAIASNKALEQQRLEEVATKQRAAANQKMLDQLYGHAFVQDPDTGTFTFKRDLVEQGLAQSGQGHLLPQITKDLDAMDTAAQAGAAKRRTTVAQALHNITTQGFTNESALTNLAYLKQNHLIPEDRMQAMLDQLAQDGSPDAVKALVTRVGGALPEYQQLVNTEAERVAKLKKLEAETANLAPKPIEVSPGGTVYNPVTKQVEYTAPPKDPATLDAAIYAARDNPQELTRLLALKRQDAEAGRAPVDPTVAAIRDYTLQAARQNAGAGMTTQQNSTFQRIADTYERSPLVKAADRTIILKQAITAAEKDPNNPANQLQLAYSYIQALDTYQSAVREGELQNLGMLGTKWQELGVTVNRLVTSGAFIPPEVAKQIATNAKTIADTIDKGRQQKRLEFGSRAKASGVGSAWDQYMTGVDAATGGGGGGAGAGRTRVKGPNGETGTVPAGSPLPPGWTEVK